MRCIPRARKLCLVPFLSRFLSCGDLAFSTCPQLISSPMGFQEPESTLSSCLLSLDHGSLVTQLYHILPVNGPRKGLKSPPRPVSNPFCAFDLELDRVPKQSSWMADCSGQSPAVSRQLQEAGTGCSALVGVWIGARWICWGSVLCLQGKKKPSWVA